MMMKHVRAVFGAVALLAGTVGAPAARSEVPNLIDFQSTLLDAEGRPATGQFGVTFTLYNAQTGGTQVWQETQTVTVMNGVYSTGLGAATVFPDSLWQNAQLWLGIRPGAGEELAQRVRIVAVPYALRAKVAERVEGSGGGGGGDLPVGAMVMSTRANDPALLDDGYLQTRKAFWDNPDAWVRIAPSGAPEFDYYSGGYDTSATAVWTGSEMIVWGLSEGTTRSGRLDPAGSTWTAVSTTNAPAGRLYHTAVWTGSRMIVWGGYAENEGGSEYLGTGGVYDPATDTWSPTSVVNAPAGRLYHTAVWTGSRMIVWGGAAQNEDGSACYLNTGGVYDPATDTWSPPSVVNAPAARCAQAAVWTGSRMIVWGGRDGESYGAMVGLSTGGVYDPATDTWSPTSVVNAPTPPPAYMSTEAVWTGSRMVVWGGSQGFVYDPATDTWAPVSTNNAPQSGDMVWTGSRMIVWNCVSGSRSGVYDPATDTWTPVSTSNQPESSGMSMPPLVVWTGSRMLAWLAGTRTGGLYDPAADGFSYIYIRQ